MDSFGFFVFETTLGACGLAWGPDGLVGVQLPEGEASATAARLGKRFPQAAPAESPPAWITELAEAVQGLLRGEPRDLSSAPLDLSRTPELHRQIYAVTRAIRPGATLTYGDIARRLGDPNLAQAVGQAMGRNPFPIVVPCHRVLAAGGRMGGFSAHGGVATKKRLLQIEGARRNDPLPLFPAAEP